MSQENSNTTAMERIAKINGVEGFDPSELVERYTDLSSGEERAHLPVYAQMAWFRLVYPQGKIAVRVTQGNCCFVAHARVYPNYKDGEECFLAEGTASRGKCEEKLSVSPREWAQTAAIGVALRNAGFGLQFKLSGEDFSEIAADEFAEEAAGGADAVGAEREKAEEKPLTLQERYEAALKFECRITKYRGKTMGEIMRADPRFIDWLVNKYQGEDELKAAARTICEYAASQVSA